MTAACWVSLLVLLIGAVASFDIGDYGGMSRKEFIETLGLGKDLFRELKKPTLEIKESVTVGDVEFDPKAKGAEIPVLFGIILTPRILEALENAEKRIGRHKRSLFSGAPARWPTTNIKYILDGFDKDEERVIEAAIDEFEDKTCFDFDEDDDNPHIRFLNPGKNSIIPCASQVGFSGTGCLPQTIFLSVPDCVAEVGIVLRHIAQTLGFWPEVFREDRDKYVQTNGLKQVLGNSPDYYDFNSVLHFESYFRGDLSVEFREKTPFFIIPKFEDFTSKTDIWRQGLGQLQQLSFWDAKEINRQYCSCPGTDPKCQNNGFIYGEDEDDCKKADCICPNGFAGDKCDKIDDDVDGECKGEQEIRLDTGSFEPTCIQTPGYDKDGYDGEDDIKCNWKFVTRNNHIYFYFDGPFDLYCRNSFVCDHWVEIGGFDDDVTQPGPRFCCNRRPIPFKDVHFGGGEGTKGSTLLVTFRTPKKVKGKFRGFRLCANDA